MTAHKTTVPDPTWTAPPAVVADLATGELSRTPTARVRRQGRGRSVHTVWAFIVPGEPLTPCMVNLRGRPLEWLPDDTPVTCRHCLAKADR